MNIENKLKVLKRFFENPIEVDGFIYEFVNIETNIDFMDSISFKVNVVLPEPNQSYVIQVFNEQIENIIGDSFKLIGENFSYSLEITIDGEELFPNTYSRIRSESLKIILNKINEKFNRIGISLDDKKNLDMSFRASWDKLAYESDEENLNFNLKIELSNFALDGKYVIPKPQNFNALAQFLWETLADREWFVPVMEYIIYEEINPETKIGKTEDVYVQLLFRINRINGTLVKHEIGHLGIGPQSFIEVS